jgi:phosphoglucosamine mutase
MRETRIFGTDGVRGTAGEGWLTPENVTLIAGSAASELTKPGDLVPIGHDTRESSKWIAMAAAAGVMAAGADVEYVEKIPTPGLAHIVKVVGAAMGIDITASHNPWEDNGIKLFSFGGNKLPDHVEDLIDARITAGDSARRRDGKGKFYLGEGRIESYEDYLIDTLDGNLAGLHIALDMAHGATSGIAEKVFKLLGAEVLPLNDNPNGRNINDGCGAVDDGIRGLQEVVSANGWQMGAAFDGDGDRLIMVDESGDKLDGDNIIFINAVAEEVPGVVVTQMSNKSLGTELDLRGIPMYRTEKVGDRYVLADLNVRDLNLGGEQSGHIIKRNLMPTGDGILAAIHTANHVRRSGGSLAEWRRSLPLLPQILMSVPLPGSVLGDERVQEAIVRHEAELGAAGRVYVRASGTEAKVRVMVESGTEEDAARRAGELASLMKTSAA